MFITGFKELSITYLTTVDNKIVKDRAASKYSVMSKCFSAVPFFCYHSIALRLMAKTAYDHRDYARVNKLLHMEKKVRLTTNSLHSMARAIGMQVSACTMLFILMLVTYACV